MEEIDYVSIKGFRSIRSQERVSLRPVNVVIGPNGAGKSNFVGVFAFLQSIRDGRLQEYVARAGGAEKLLFFGAKQTSEIELEIAFRNEKNKYWLKLIHGAGDRLIASEERVFYWNKDKHPAPFDDTLEPNGNEAGISREHAEKSIPMYVGKHLSSWRLYHFHDTSGTSPMKQTSQVNDNRFLRPDGANLAAFLYLLKIKYPNKYQLIRSVVGQVAPFLKDFALEPLELNENSIRLEWVHKKTEVYFDSSALSDGTLRFIALATLLLQPSHLRPSVILIDEPELGLHPYAVSVLASVIKQAATLTQVVVATQSPLLLDYFEPEDVLVAEQEEGETRFNRLNAKELDQWLTDYGLGQLWEKNYLGARPIPCIEA